MSKDRKKNRNKKLGTKRINKIRKKEIKRIVKRETRSRRQPNHRPRYNASVATGQEIISDLDKMTFAKRFPGTINAPYVAAMNTSPLGTLKANNGFTISQCVDPTHTLVNLGTHKYTLIVQMSSLTAMHNPITNIPGYSFVAPAVRNSGVYIKQTDSTTTVFNGQEFLRTGAGLPASEIFGSDFESFSEKGFSWALRTNWEIVAPSANISAKVWKGRLLYGQLFDSARKGSTSNWWDGGGISLTLQQLINIAQEVELGDKSTLNLQTALVNNNLPYNESSSDLASITDFKHLAGYMGQSAFAGEVIEFAIIQNAAMNITTGALMPFTFVCEAHQNLAFFPKASDAIMNNLFRTNQNSATYTHMSANSKLDHIEAQIGTTNIPLTTPRMAKDLTNLSNTQEDHPAWYSKVYRFLRKHKSVIKAGLNATSGFLPGGGFLNQAADVLLDANGKKLVYCGLVRKRLEDTSKIYDFGDPNCADQIKELLDLQDKLLTYLRGKPYYYEVEQPLKPVIKETDSYDRLRELSQIGMKTESEISEFRQLAANFDKDTSRFVERK